MAFEGFEHAGTVQWRDSLERSRRRRMTAARRRAWRLRRRGTISVTTIATLAVSGAALANTGGVQGPGQQRSARAAQSNRAIAAELAKIARCESGGDPHAVSPDGRYRGKYQFDRQTWASLGGHGDPARAPEAVQDRLARKLYLERGKAPWPNCA